jgi:hypothetical protein
MQIDQYTYQEPVPSEGIPSEEFGEQSSGRLIAFLSPVQWVVGILISALATIPIQTYTSRFSGWLTGAIFLTSLMVFHFVASLGRLVPIPHIAIFTAAISYIIAPLASFYYPPSNPTYVIVQPEIYFDYAAPGFCFVVLGWLTPFFWSKRPILIPALHRSEEDSSNERTLFLIFWLGLGFTLIRFLFTLPSLANFVVVLLSHFRYVACGAWIASGRRGRAGLIIGTLLLELLQSVYSSMFHEFFLWAACMFCLWVGSRGPSRLFAFTLLILGAALLFPLQQTKTRYRKALFNSTGLVDSSREESFLDSVSGRVNLFQRQFYDTLSEKTENIATEKTLGDDLVRFNQGWLVARVLNYVPNMEPFASGGTIRTALISAALPRFIYSEKFETGGREFLRRFTGIYLSDRTSMNIGYLGEMYGNFGRSAGLLGCFLYALVLSGVFRWVSLLSTTRPQLVGLVPFLCFRMPVAESDLSDVLNYLAKALLIIGILRLSFPALFRNPSPVQDTAEN